MLLECSSASGRRAQMASTGRRSDVINSETDTAAEKTPLHLFEEIIGDVVIVRGQPAVAARERSDEDVVAVVENPCGRWRLTACVRDADAIHVY